ncbi:MAG: pilus retraction protein PilT [Verrucomicrobiales bacterium]|jgi:pilus retraction protein PilT
MSIALNVSQYIDSAITREASDTFLSEGVGVRMKINGTLQEVGDTTLDRESLREFWLACGQDPDCVMDADTAYVAPSGVRFRVNLFRHMGRLGAVLRQIKTQIPNMKSLGLPTALLTSWVSAPSGLLLVTGPTGCGKSTTLASCLEWINQNSARHVVTIEDPIEYQFVDQKSLFSQREVHTDTESFAKGLRSSLRQAPDVILLGEIRDAESARIALQAAETGHLVLSTVHSSGVQDTLDRLLHLFSDQERHSLLGLLSAQLIGIFSQMMLPAADGNGVHVVTEHLNNEGATRLWIREARLAELQDFLGKSDDGWNLSFMRSLVAAARTGQVEKEVARRASSNATEFDRAMLGISS